VTGRREGLAVPLAGPRRQPVEQLASVPVSLPGFVDDEVVDSAVSFVVEHALDRDAGDGDERPPAGGRTGSVCVAPSSSPLNS